MWELIVSICDLFMAIASTAFSLYKQVIGVQNDFLAAFLGVSPFVVTCLCFLLRNGLRIIKAGLK